MIGLAQSGVSLRSRRFRTLPAFMCSSSLGWGDFPVAGSASTLLSCRRWNSCSAWPRWCRARGLHLIRFHRVLAPNAKLRSEIIPRPVEQATEPLERSRSRAGRAGAAIRFIPNSLRAQTWLPPKADGAARSEFERAVRSGKLRAPPTAALPEPTETTMGFSSSRKGIDNSLGPAILLGPENRWFKFPIHSIANRFGEPGEPRHDLP
jgi:hypothetical protein